MSGFLSGRRSPPVQEAVGGGIPVTPEEAQAANEALSQQEAATTATRPETFEISQEAGDHASESGFDEDAAEREAQHAASVQADQTVIESIRQVFVLHRTTCTKYGARENSLLYAACVQA